MSYPVSTAKNGLGEKLNSGSTPRGLHRIRTKHGQNAPMFGILSNKGYTGSVAKIINYDSPSDHITSRSMRLEGVEYGLNKGGNNDSFNRHIFIHGTHEEGLIGSPVSHGCIRLKNQDVIDLFNRVNEGTYVLILSL